MDPRIQAALGAGRLGVRHTRFAIWRRRIVAASRRRVTVVGYTLAAAVAFAATWWAIGTFGAALAGPPPPAAPAIAVIAPDEAEQVYLAEIGYAGVQLAPEEQQAAVEIAREHVAHGHLIGMRHLILGDFAERIPRLSAEQRDVARVAVEHHFLAVTGRKQ